MNEKLLQYLWNFKVFTHYNFTDLDGNPIEIVDFGKWNKNSGPDFLMAKIKINNVILAGNIELHVRSSDWIFHQHSKILITTISFCTLFFKMTQTLKNSVKRIFQP